MKPSLFILILASSALADTAPRPVFEKIETTDGQIFTEVRLQTLYKDQATFMHSTGSVSIPFSKLPPDILEQIDPKKADDHAKPELPLSDPSLPPYPLKLDRLVTMDGQEYKDVVIVNVGVIELSFRHALGSASVPFVRLPEAIRALYLYDPEKADKYLEEIKAFLAERKREEADKKDRAPQKAPQPAVTLTPPAAAPVAKSDPPADFLSGQNRPAERSLVGMWFRDLGKGKTAIKTYGCGHCAVTVYDDHNIVTDQNQGTWEMEGKASVEKIHHATASWKHLIGKTIRFKEVLFPTSTTCKIVYEDGNSETWKRLP